jgi:GT2 family glycosyltransferase
MTRGAHGRDSSTKPGTIKASIIVTSWNGLSDTRRCLASLRRWTPAPHEVIVVDNGSTDGTPEFLAAQARRPGAALRVRRHRTNRGFGAAVNTGAALAKGPFIVWLNNDVVVTPGWLEGLLEAAAARPKAGAAGPSTNEIGGGGPQQIARASYRGALGAARFARAWSLGPGPRHAVVPKLAGFCLAVSRGAMRRVGPLDESFELGGYEDLDYCLRLRRAGYELIHARRVFVHHGGHNAYRLNGLPRALSRRGLERFLEKWTAAGLDALEYSP